MEECHTSKVLRRQQTKLQVQMDNKNINNVRTLITVVYRLSDISSSVPPDLLQQVTDKRE